MGHLRYERHQMQEQQRSSGGGIEIEDLPPSLSAFILPWLASLPTWHGLERASNPRCETMSCVLQASIRSEWYMVGIAVSGANSMGITYGITRQATKSNTRLIG